MCREHDPSGKRTVGVVTKPDRADPGIRDRLEATGAEYLRLDMGYVAVRIYTAECVYALQNHGSTHFAMLYQAVLVALVAHVLELFL